MRNNKVTTPRTFINSQPGDLRELSEIERDALIVSSVQVEGRWITLSRYGDDVWKIDGLPSNSPDSRKNMDFRRVPAQFRAVMKEMLYRYRRRGRNGQKRPSAGTQISFFGSALPFLRYLESLKVSHLGSVPPILYTNYVNECRSIQSIKGRPLAQSSILNRLLAVEAIFELSQYTHDPLKIHPWPDASPKTMVGLTGSGSYRYQGGKTPLMPDDVFCTLFEKAYEQVMQGQALLNLRDEVNAIGNRCKWSSYGIINYTQKKYLAAQGWKGGMTGFNKAVTSLRTACYIVIASTTGCRNHELANVQSGSHHRTEDNEGNLFHWMRSKSEKTYAGIHDWMIPVAAVRALRLMERWAEPYQSLIAKEIVERRKTDPHDPEIARAHLHRHALFLGVIDTKTSRIRTLTLTSWKRTLTEFSVDAGLDWSLTSHQFRRKFANYAAHSRFGDLRYLREHFAHWSMDMTLGYAMDESWGSHLDLDLYNDIQAEYEDIKFGIVNSWTDADSLAGGYGRSFKQWQRDPSNLAIFKDHKTMVVSISESTAIRSNGHAWCTADNDGCVGNTLDPTRCGNCNNGVISRGHIGIYRQLYLNLQELLQCSDIGETGRIRVLRDMQRCRDVMIQLGYDPENIAA